MRDPLSVPLRTFRRCAASLAAAVLWAARSPLPAAEPPASVADVHPLAFEEAFDLARRRSETLARRREGVAEAGARVDELWSAVKPSVAFLGTELIQDSSDNGQGGVAGTFNRRTRPEVRFTAHQPIFSGFREYVAARAAALQGRALEADLRRAESLLYLDVARAYLDLLDKQQEIHAHAALRDITRDRVMELTERRRVGRSRDSEVLAAESHLAQMEADIEEAKGFEVALQEDLRFLTGLEGTLAPKQPLLPSPEPLGPFLDRVEARYDVEARRREQRSAELAVDFARRERWPSAAADGNYYLKRTGFQENIAWDVTLSARWPLYTGGGVGARVRQAEARRRAADEALTEASRRASSEVRSAYGQLTSVLAKLAALEKAVTLAEKNAEAQTRDYRQGLVTNLDVLGSLDELDQTRLRRDQARWDAMLLRARLEVAAGGPEPVKDAP